MYHNGVPHTASPRGTPRYITRYYACSLCDEYQNIVTIRVIPHDALRHAFTQREDVLSSLLLTTTDDCCTGGSSKDADSVRGEMCFYSCENTIRELMWAIC